MMTTVVPTGDSINLNDGGPAINTNTAVQGTLPLNHPRRRRWRQLPVGSLPAQVQAAASAASAPAAVGPADFWTLALPASHLLLWCCNHGASNNDGASPRALTQTQATSSTTGDNLNGGGGQANVDRLDSSHGDGESATMHRDIANSDTSLRDEGNNSATTTTTATTTVATTATTTTTIGNDNRDDKDPPMQDNTHNDDGRSSDDDNDGHDDDDGHGDDDDDGRGNGGSGAGYFVWM
ncbi:hypothetical protein EDB89DRAFT_1910875 [Lactarius sanguifluus]|nr:hypothetical protein EDB89DRAFT_1910875 [Lactarius sanguifluus]